MYFLRESLVPYMLSSFSEFGDASSTSPPKRGQQSTWAVFTSKISLSKLHYSPITSNLLPHAWSIKCR